MVFRLRPASSFRAEVTERVGEYASALRCLNWCRRASLVPRYADHHQVSASPSVRVTVRSPRPGQPEETGGVAGIRGQTGDFCPLVSSGVVASHTLGD